MLLAFGAENDARSAFDALRETLANAGTPVRARVGYKGGSVEDNVTWHHSVEMWSLLREFPPRARQEGRRFWCCFGIDDPHNAANLDITVEINPRHQGTDLLVAGVFAKDMTSTVHLCHNGKIGGGRKGVGKTAFFHHYGPDFEKMRHGNGCVKVVDLGPITSRGLPRRLAWFARKVKRIKEACANERHGNAPLGDDVDWGRPTFSPEFSGSRSAYSVSRRIEAKADHGVVIDALEAAVKRIGHVAANDGARDLFVLDEKNRPTVLFEVKTELTTTSIYTAVGQLLLNGGAVPDSPRKVLAVPGEPEPDTHEALRAVGIHVLSFAWRGDNPVIAEKDLRRVMRR